MSTRQQLTQAQRFEMEMGMIRAGLEFGLTALKAAMLINGAAAIAILAFLGALASGELEFVVVTRFARALLLFVLGTLIAAFSAGSGYLSQYHSLGVPSGQPAKRARFFQKITIYLVLVAFLFFVLGVYQSYRSILLIA